jgi:streptogramin lyase
VRVLAQTVVLGRALLLLIVVAAQLCICRPARAQELTEFNLPTRSGPLGITVGPDGNLWFVERDAGQIGTITPDGSTITEFPLPAGAGSQPYAITSGPDGNLWFVERAANQIGQIDLTGTVAEFPLASTGGGLCDITTGPDGDLWFAECTAGRIGHIRAASPNTITEIALLSSGRSSGVANGPDAAIWFTDVLSNRIGRIPQGGASPDATFPVKEAPLGITTGPDGNLWFVEEIQNAIGRLTPSGVFTEFPLPTENAVPARIAAGPDGNVWFAESAVNGIGRITPNGAITEFVTPGRPMGITAGPDGNVWFTEPVLSHIVRFTPPPLAACGATPQAGCRKPSEPHKAAFEVKNASGKPKDHLTWKWLKGEATDVADFGDPLNTTSYALCIYDAAGGAPALIASVVAPEGGSCAGKPCWKTTGAKVLKGYQYKSGGSLLKIVLTSGDIGKAKITVANAASNLLLPASPLHQDPQVTVQLVNSDGFCWDADYSAPAVKNDTKRFKDKSD